MASNRILIGFLPPEPSPYVVLPKNLKIKFYHLAETSLQCYRTVPSAEPSLPYIYIYIYIRIFFADPDPATLKIYQIDNISFKKFGSGSAFIFKINADPDNYSTTFHIY